MILASSGARGWASLEASGHDKPRGVLRPLNLTRPPQSAFHACADAAFSMMYVIRHERIDFYLIFPCVPLSATQLRIQLRVAQGQTRSQRSMRLISVLSGFGHQGKRGDMWLSLRMMRAYLCGRYFPVFFSLPPPLYQTHLTIIHKAL